MRNYSAVPMICEFSCLYSLLFCIFLNCVVYICDLNVVGFKTYIVRIKQNYKTVDGVLIFLAIKMYAGL